jgi:hypothetical protein
MQLPIAACKFASLDVRARCADSTRFCQQDEEHDPGEDFEEYLACSVCGDNGKLLQPDSHVEKRK